MLLRAIALASLLPGVPPRVDSAQKAPQAATRYRVDQTLTQEADGSAMGGGKQSIRFTTSSFVTVTLADSAGGKAIRVVVDSMRGDSATPIPRPVLDSARGAEFRGFVSPRGKLDGLEATAGGTSPGARVQGLLADFFPWTRAGLKAGQRWTDTTARSTGSGTDSVTVRRVTAYRTAAGARRGAPDAVRVSSDFTSSVGGTQATPNGPAKLEGSGAGSGTYFVGPDGRYLGGDWRQRSELKISGSFAPQPLPISVVQTIKVTPLR